MEVIVVCVRKGSGGDQSNILCKDLERLGYRVWYDNRQNALHRNLEGMKRGVRQSMCLMIFLSGRRETDGVADMNGLYEGPFTRWFCHEEMTTAHEHGLRCIGVVETDERKGKPDMGLEKSRALTGRRGGPVNPNAMHNVHLLADVCFIPFRRQQHEVDSMLAEIQRQAAEAPALRPYQRDGPNCSGSSGMGPTVTVFIAHRGLSKDVACAKVLQQCLPGASAGMVSEMVSAPKAARVLVCVLCHDETPFGQIHHADDPMRQALATVFQGEQVVIPVVGSGFTMDSLEGLPDDIRSLARQLFVLVDWRAPDEGIETLLSCIGQIRRTSISPVLRHYLESTIQQTETFPDPCTQETIHTETQCVPLKLLTVSALEESRKHSTAQIDEADRLLMRRRLGLGGTVGYGDTHFLRSAQDVHEADVHFAEVRDGQLRGAAAASAAMMTVSVIVGPAACGKTTLLNRTTCGYAKDALRGCPGAMVPYVIRVMAFSRWLIKNDKTLTKSAFKEFVLMTECAGDEDEGGLYAELMQLFDAGQLALIFDGLDESGTKLEAITAFLSDGLGKSYVGRMIISSRESLFDESLFTSSRFQMLQIQPLTEAMQVDVLRRRFTDAQDVKEFKEQQSSSENLKEMGTNPLLLALQIGVFLLDDKQLPELRTDLYEKGARLLLRRVEIGESGERKVKAVAAAMQKPLPKKRHSKMDTQVQARFDVLCQTGYLLHVQEKTRDFAAGDIFDLLEDEATDLGSISRDDAVAAWEDLLRDGRGIIMCVEQDVDGDSMNDTWRSTHLTLQEYFAAKQCVTNARASGDLLQNLETVFGVDPSPWLREILLMVAEMLTQDEFKLLADYYLDHDDDSGAASVRITTMLKCRREDITTGIGAYIKHRLSQTRSVELMAEALCHPSDTLRRQALTEIEEFGMAKEEIAEKLLALISADCGPWFLRLGGTQSLGKLQVCNARVLLKLSAVGFTTQAGTDWLWREEALRALKTLSMQSSQAVDSALTSILIEGPADDRHRAWKVIKWLEISSKSVLDKLAEHMADDSSDVSEYLATARAALQPEPEPESELETEPEPQLLPRLEPESDEQVLLRTTPHRQLDGQEFTAQPATTEDPVTAVGVHVGRGSDYQTNSDELSMSHTVKPEPEPERLSESELETEPQPPDIDCGPRIAELLAELDVAGGILQSALSADAVGTDALMATALGALRDLLIKHLSNGWLLTDVHRGLHVEQRYGSANGTLHDLFHDDRFLQHLCDSFKAITTDFEGLLGIALVHACFLAAGQVAVAGEPSRHAEQAYLFGMGVRDKLRREDTMSMSNHTLLCIMGLLVPDGRTDCQSTKVAATQNLLRLLRPSEAPNHDALRYIAFDPLLYYIRAEIDPTSEQSERLRVELGAQLSSITGIESMFLRKELKVGKFEMGVPFWTGAIDIEDDRKAELGPEPEPEPELEPGSEDAEPEPEPELVETAHSEHLQTADALGRADKPLPVGTRIAVSGFGQGSYVSCETHWFGSSDHSIAFDSGLTRVVQLRGGPEWTVFPSEMESSTYKPATQRLSLLGSTEQPDAQLAQLNVVSRWATARGDAASIEHSQRRPVMFRDNHVTELQPSDFKQTPRNRLGKGTYATVYRAEWRGVKVAVKAIELPRRPRDESAGDRHRMKLQMITRDFVNEVNVSCELLHPNLVQMLGYATVPSLIIVLELLNGGSLDKQLYVWHWRPSRLQMLKAALNIASGMEYLHTRFERSVDGRDSKVKNPVIHRDLKSPNIFLDRSPPMKPSDDWSVELKISGFERSGFSTESSGFSPIWAAPEILDGSETNESVDVYSYAMCLIELSHCTMPWQDTGALPHEVPHRVVNNQRPVSQLREASEEMKQLIRDCWHQCVTHPPLPPT